MDGNKVNTVFHIDDIESEIPGIPFTDGSGNIHEDLAAEINEHYRIKYCTAYQIRIAGYKGVLVLKESTMKGLVEMRPSMRKFEGKDFNLGIIRCATYSVAYLNRQVIMLLSSLNKQMDHIFMEKQGQAKRMLDKRVTHGHLIRQVIAYMAHETTDVTDMHREFELHFGPSQQFKQIFVKALMYEAILRESALK